MSPPRRFRLPSRRRQAGAAAVFAAIALIAGLTAAMLAIDLGRVYNQHRQLQKLAALAALDASRVVGGCDRTTPPAHDDVAARVLDSLQRNAAAASVVAATDDVQLGTQRFAAVRGFDASTADDANSVGVTLTQPFPEPLLPLLPSTTKHMTAHAVATQSVIGAVSVGSSLLTLDSSRSALLDTLVGKMLGGNVNLGLVTWQSLASANVKLGDLALALGADDVAGALGQTITRNQALTALAAALAASGDAATSTLAGTVSALAAIPDTHGVHLQLGDVLTLEDGVENLVDELPVSALDLLMAVIEDSAIGYPIALDLAPGISGVGSLTVHLRIGQAPQIAVGRPGYRLDGTPRTQAHTAQIYLEIDVEVLDLLNTLSAGIGKPVSLSFALELAAADAVLEEVRCARAETPRHQAVVQASSDLVAVWLGTFNLNAANVGAPAAAGTLINVPLLLSLKSTSPALLGHFGDSGTQELLFEGPFVPKTTQIDPDKDVREIAGDIQGDLDGIESSLASYLGGLKFGGTAGVVLNALPAATRLLKLQTVLAPVSSVLGTVIDDVLALAGADAGGATVTLQSLKVKSPEVYLKQ